MTEPAPTGPFAALLSELDKCVRCGECRVVCPVFDQLRREKFHAPGQGCADAGGGPRARWA